MALDGQFGVWDGWAGWLEVGQSRRKSKTALLRRKLRVENCVLVSNGEYLGCLERVRAAVAALRVGGGRRQAEVAELVETVAHLHDCAQFPTLYALLSICVNVAG